MPLDAKNFFQLTVGKKSDVSRDFGSHASDIGQTFQDRLVVTASIFLLIYCVVYYTIYKQSYFEVARETLFTNSLRIPHEDTSSLLVSGKCGHLHQRRNIPITMQFCAIIQVLNCFLVLDIALDVIAYAIFELMKIHNL